MAKQPTCYDCAYSYFDRGHWMATIGMGWPGAPVCANQPESYGRTRPVPRGGVCCNYRARAATPKGDVKQIPLGEGYCAYVDAADYEWLSRWNWSLNNGYAARREKGKLIFMHREIARPPKGKVVDHQNRNRMDNTRTNLLVCTPEENGRNKGKRQGASSRFRGVHYAKNWGKWCALIWFKGTHVYIGSFTDEVAAARAYDRKAVELLGESARLNFPEEWPPGRRKKAKAKTARKRTTMRSKAAPRTQRKTKRKATRTAKRSA